MCALKKLPIPPKTIGSRLHIFPVLSSVIKFNGSSVQTIKKQKKESERENAHK